jgi:hypothetical protein
LLACHLLSQSFADLSEILIMQATASGVALASKSWKAQLPPALVKEWFSRLLRGWPGWATGLHRFGNRVDKAIRFRDYRVGLFNAIVDSLLQSIFSASKRCPILTVKATVKPQVNRRQSL